MIIENETLAELRGKVGGTEPVPAGVSISAVTASLALALLAKVLDITGKRKDFSGDRDRLDSLIESARAESTRLTQLADEDVRAFNQYLECVREDKDRSAAIRQTIDVPMKGARSAVRGLDACAEAVTMVHGLTAADLGIAAALLSGAVRAMLISVDFNIREMHPDKAPPETLTTERRDLELQALRRDDAITHAVEALLA
jgi:formiminotetrahydrofolate cyclodeaminase